MNNELLIMNKKICYDHSSEVFILITAFPPQHCSVTVDIRVSEWNRGGVNRWLYHTNTKKYQTKQNVFIRFSDKFGR